MSDIPADLNLREQIARIDNLQEEARKFAAEQHRLAAEAAKLQRDRWLAPLLLVVSALGAVGGILTVFAGGWGVLNCLRAGFTRSDLRPRATPPWFYRVSS